MFEITAGCNEHNDVSNNRLAELQPAVTFQFVRLQPAVISTTSCCIQYFFLFQEVGLMLTV